MQGAPRQKTCPLFFIWGKLGASFIDGLLETNKKSDLMMVGDFNVNLATITTKSELLIQEMAARNVYQLITKPTRVTSTSSTIKDHVYLKLTKAPHTLTIVSDI